MVATCLPRKGSAQIATAPSRPPNISSGSNRRMNASGDISQNAATITGIDDGNIRNFCLSVAGFINEVSQYEIYEHNGSISEIDSAFKTVIFPAPLSYTHQLIRYFLEGVRDGLVGISNIFSHDAVSHVPIAVLSRQIVEYSASAHYLSDPDDVPEMRLAKMLSMYKPSLVKRRNGSPAVQELYDQANRILSHWQGGTSLPAASPPFGSITDAVARLLGGFTDRKVSDGYYRRLSGLAHGSPRDLTELYEVTWRESKEMLAVHYGEAVGDVTVGLRSAFAAMLRAIQLHAAPSELERQLLGLKMKQFGLIIDEMTVRLGEFWKTDVPRLAGEAYASRGMERPRLSDLFDIGGGNGEEAER